MSRVTGNSQLQSDVLEELSDARRYRRWLADLARPYLGANPIEIGSGTGDYALEWLPQVATFTATEADEARHRQLAGRFTGHHRVRVRYLMLGEETGPGAAPEHSAVVAYNVFEHIPDHVGALRSAARLVQPGGAVILIVPAFPSAMSRFDRAIGHQRRYTKATMRAAFAEAGLAAETVRYLNPIGLLTWYTMVKVLNVTPRNGAALRVHDAAVVPVSRALDRVPAPFGQSVFAVARVLR